MSFEELVELEKISASDLNSNMPFLRNEFSKISDDLFEDDEIYRDDSYLWSSEEKIRLETCDWSEWAFKLKEIHESFPTAWGLRKIYDHRKTRSRNIFNEIISKNF